MIKIHFSNGTSNTYNKTDTLSVLNFPPSEFYKPGYEKTRDDPPEWSRFTSIRMTALSIGAYISFGNQIVRIESIENGNE